VNGAPLTEYFAGALLDEFDNLPTEFGKLLAEIDAELAGGLPLFKARELLKPFGIERFNIAPKTWINGLCAARHLEPARKDGKVAYRKGTVNWPARH
jgi:hypothetical protein